MEYGVDKMKAVLAVVLASLMVCAAAAPAVAQDGDGATATAGDATATAGSVNIQYQDCRQIINQYANADQSNTGGDLAAAIAQDLDISQNAVNACIQAGGDINLGGDGGDGTDPPADGDTDPPDDGTVTNGDENGGSTDAASNPQSNVLADTIPDKVLANTGGVSAASMLLPAGALLVVSGAMTFWLGIRRR